MKKRKRETLFFTINDLLAISLTLVVAGIGIAYGLQVMGDVKEDMCGETPNTTYDESNCWSCADYGTYRYNISGNNCYNLSEPNQTTTSRIMFGRSTEYNATSDSVDGVAKIPNKFPTIATVLVASIIIGILVTYLWARFR